jgi:hypothetical protein
LGNDSWAVFVLLVVEFVDEQMITVRFRNDEQGH